ncbi:hypothetical protein [Neobacillus cucumis]|uniref:hypothetical protein n=1 Tax=Neobacillus cucumis TaxID=1740721 RepID=UPI0019646625|nr:hypothetical protein [Neobacillus cucumis]MBM7656409.1 hypothetical protein [Neobacillus cucumis]
MGGKTKKILFVGIASLIVVIIAIQVITSVKKREQVNQEAIQEAKHKEEQAKVALAKAEAKKKADIEESKRIQKFSDLVTKISEHSNGVIEMVTAGRELNHWRGNVYINEQSWFLMKEAEKKSLTELVGNDVKSSIVNSGWGKKEDKAFIAFYTVKNNSESELKSGRKLLNGYSVER